LTGFRIARVDAERFIATAAADVLRGTAAGREAEHVAQAASRVRTTCSIVELGHRWVPSVPSLRVSQAALDSSAGSVSSGP